MKIKKAMFCFLLLGFILLSGCTKEKAKQIEEENAPAIQEEKKVQLSVLYSGEDVNWVATIEELGENFMREYPNIILDMEPSESGIYTETLKTKEALDEFPDIFEIQDPFMFAEAGKLGEMPENISKLVEDPITIADKVYAVPLYTTTYGIVYNQVLFKKYGIAEPKTYGEFLEVCRKFKDYGITPLAVGGSKAGNVSYWFNYYFQTDIIADTPDWQARRNSKDVFFQDADMTAMMENYKSLMTGSYILEDSINMNDNQLVSEFVDCKVAMIYTGPWMFSQIIDAYPLATESDKGPLGEDIKEDQVTCRLAWFFMPDANGNTVVINEYASEWGISKTCEEDFGKKEAAVLFFRYFYQTVNYRKVLQSMYAIPTTKEAILYPAPGVSQKLLTGYRYAEKNGSYLGNNETPEGFENVLYKVLNSVATDVMSVETAMEKLDEAWDSIIER